MLQQGAEEPPQPAVRVSIVAKKRVTIVEPRDTGKKRCNDRKRAKYTAASASEGYTRRSPLRPSMGLGGRLGLDSANVGDLNPRNQGRKMV